MIGAVVGAVAAACAFAPGFVLGTSSYWDNPRGDVKMQVTGQLHYLRAPWSWPLGVATTIDPPRGFVVAFADTTPLLALVTKLLRPLLPDAFAPMLAHPYGAWLVVTWVLHGVFSARLAWELRVRGTVALACAAALACTLPAFVIRAGHTSLEAHFLLVWGLLLVVRAAKRRARTRDALELCAVVGLAALIHPYLLAMVAVLAAAWVVTTATRGRAPGAAAIGAAGAAAAGIVPLAAFGTLGEPLHWAPFFGEASFNPASLVLTRFAAVNPLGRVVDPIGADATGYQYEGYDYLGLGVLALALFVVVRHRRAIVPALRRHATLAIALAACTLFAASNHGFVGHRAMWSFEVPEALRVLVAQLRSSGRFVWAPTYALVFFLVAQVARERRTGAAVLTLATLLQLADTRPHFAWVRDLFGTPDERAIDLALWDRTLARHDAVYSYPSFDCVWMLRGAWEDPNYKALYQVALRAAAAGKTVNSIHNPRPGRDCLDDVRERETAVPRAGTVYVFMRRAATDRVLSGMHERGARCLPFDRGYACSTAFGDDDVRAYEASAAPARYELGQWIAFGGDGMASAPYEGGAWGPRTAEGAYVGWPAEGSRSSIHFLLDRPRVRSRVVELEVEAEEGALTPTEIAVEADGKPLGTLRLAPGERRTVSYRVRGRRDGTAPSFLAVDLIDHPGEGRARLRVRRVRLVDPPHRYRREVAQHEDGPRAEEVE